MEGIYIDECDMNIIVVIIYLVYILELNIIVEGVEKKE